MVNEKKVSMNTSRKVKKVYPCPEKSGVKMRDISRVFLTEKTCDKCYV